MIEEAQFSPLFYYCLFIYLLLHEILLRDLPFY